MTSLDRSSKIAFVGAGTVGGSLAVSLSRCGYQVVAVASRTLSSAKGLAGRVPGCTAYESYQEAADVADVVFLTTSDDAINSVCSAVDWRPGQAAVHCSGAASLAVLEHAAAKRALPGAFHPLQAFSSVEGGVESIPGITFGIEGEDALRGYLRQMALDIGGNPVFLRPEDKVLYHLSGVMMGNLLTEYAALSAQLWDHLGMSREEGIRALLPMMRQVTVNLDTSGVPGAVAGPYVRGDVGTIRKHLEALGERVPELMPLYRELALAGLRYPVEKGALSRERAAEIKSLLEGFGSAPGDAYQGERRPLTLCHRGGTTLRVTIRDLREMKRRGEKIPMITAYDYTSAKIVEEAGIPIILVGDSLGQVVLGYDSTVPVTMDEMVHHIKAAVRGTQRAHVVGDLPFLSYHADIAEAVRNAGRLLKEGGAQSVKLEGGRHMAETVRGIVRSGIPVMGHIGLTPQAVNQLGGFRVQGKTSKAAVALLEDARALEEAGAYALVLELVPAQLAEIISERLSIPTIGIGAGVHCDGQVQVFHDLVGLFTDFVPKHARAYANLAAAIRDATSQYVAEVGAGTFPSNAESYSMKSSVVDELTRQTGVSTSTGSG